MDIDIPTNPLVKTHLKTYCVGVMQVHESAPKQGPRNNMKIKVDGEVFTLVDFIQVLQLTEDTTKKKKRGNLPNFSEQ